MSSTRRPGRAVETGCGHRARYILAVGHPLKTHVRTMGLNWLPAPVWMCTDTKTTKMAANIWNSLKSFFLQIVVWSHGHRSVGMLWFGRFLKAGLNWKPPLPFCHSLSFIQLFPRFVGKVTQLRVEQIGIFSLRLSPSRRNTIEIRGLTNKTFQTSPRTRPEKCPHHNKGSYYICIFFTNTVRPR